MRSLQRHLLAWLLVPLLGLTAVSSLIAYVLGINIARDIYDNQLVNSADSVVARIRVKDEHIGIDMPPAALSILRHNYHDKFYYQLLTAKGEWLAGDKVLPPPDPADETEDKFPLFQTVDLDGEDVRTVTVAVHGQDMSDEGVLVRVGETRNTRMQLANQIAISILIAQLAVMGCAVAAVYVGIRGGLLPLRKVENAVASRSVGDLRPIEVDAPEEVSSLVRALNQLLAQLHDDIDLQKRFLANAAHQLRTPLAVLGTYSDLARSVVKEADAKDVLSQLDAGIQRMCHMVNRLLTLARSEPAVASLQEFKTLDLNSVASTVTANIVPEALAKGSELEFQSSSQPAWVKADQHSLEEMIANLIENAVLYNDRGGLVSVHVFIEGSDAVLRVQDEGPGIPESERGKIFERFYRIPGTEQHGTGLGLAIVREVSLTHSATVEVTSGHNAKGTSFSVRFPIANRDVSGDSVLNGNGRKSGSFSVPTSKNAK